MANPTIGHVTCPITGEKDCDVRRYSTGKKSLYYVSSAGKITPNLPAGQAWMKQNTVFIGDNGEPLPKPDKTEPEQGAEQPKRKGLLDFIFSDDDEPENR